MRLVVLLLLGFWGQVVAVDVALRSRQVLTTERQCQLKLRQCQLRSKTLPPLDLTSPLPTDSHGVSAAIADLRAQIASIQSDGNVVTQLFQDIANTDIHTLEELATLKSDTSLLEEIQLLQTQMFDMNLSNVSSAYEQIATAVQDRVDQVFGRITGQGKGPIRDFIYSAVTFSIFVLSFVFLFIFTLAALVTIVVVFLDNLGVPLVRFLIPILAVVDATLLGISTYLSLKACRRAGGCGGEPGMTCATSWVECEFQNLLAISMDTAVTGLEVIISYE